MLTTTGRDGQARALARAGQRDGNGDSVVRPCHAGASFVITKAPQPSTDAYVRKP
jgi:hypothetical protein